MKLGIAASGYSAPTNGAVRFSASNQRYSRTASGLNGTQSWTMWLKLASDRNTYQRALQQDNAASNYYGVGTMSDGTTLGRDTTSGGSVNTGYTLPTGTWVFVGAVNNTTAGQGDWFGYKPAGGSWVLSSSGAFTITGPSNSNTLYIGSDGFSDWWDGSIAAVKIWTSALTEAQLQAEAATYAAVVTSNLWAVYKFNNGPQTTDDSGNARTLTAGAGTPTLDSSGPPIT